MFLTPNKEARECRLHAEHCEEKVRLQSDPQLRPKTSSKCSNAG